MRHGVHCTRESCKVNLFVFLEQMLGNLATAQLSNLQVNASDGGGGGFPQSVMKADNLQINQTTIVPMDLENRSEVSDESRKKMTVDQSKNVNLNLTAAAASNEMMFGNLMGMASVLRVDGDVGNQHLEDPFATYPEINPI